MRTPTLPLSLHRALARHRRALAALAAAAAVLATLTALQPDRGPTVPVVVTVRPVAAGATLTDADVAPTEVPDSLVPSDAFRSPAEAVGLAVHAPLGARTIVTRATVATGQALAAPGLVVVALPLSDEALAPLVRPGTRLDLYGPTPTGSGVVASDVRVVAAPEGERGAFGTASRVALVEVTPEVAVALAAGQRSGGIAIALR